MSEPYKPALYDAHIRPVAVRAFATSRSPTTELSSPNLACLFDSLCLASLLLSYRKNLA